MDSHQAIYDAIRSRIGPANIESAVESAIRDANLSHHAEMIAHAWIGSAYEQQRPSVLYRPALSMDGNQWCALYGENLQEGVAGFGDTPSAAMLAFDHAWLNERAAKTSARNALDELHQTDHEDSAGGQQT